MPGKGQFMVNSTGYIKVGDNYINPHDIAVIGKSQDGKGTYVGYNTVAQGPMGITPTSDNIPWVNSDKFAQCAIKAMQTGEIIDVMA